MMMWSSPGGFEKMLEPALVSADDVPVSYEDMVLAPRTVMDWRCPRQDMAEAGYLAEARVLVARLKRPAGVPPFLMAITGVPPSRWEALQRDLTLPLAKVCEGLRVRGPGKCSYAVLTEDQEMHGHVSDADTFWREHVAEIKEREHAL